MIPKDLLKRLLQKIGYQKIPTSLQIQKSFHLEYASQISEVIDKVKDSTMLSYLKLATLYEKVVFLEKNNVKGALVECGVWKGGAVGMMALANLRFGRERRKIHLFDVFDDIGEPIPEIDGPQAMIDLKSLLGRDLPKLTGQLQPITGIYDSRGGHGTINDCKDLIVNKIAYPEKDILFHKGWFQNTLPSVAHKIPEIALLRLDGDWYESTKVCLEYLFDSVVSGGFIIIDDYGRYDGCRKAVDEFLASKDRNYFLNYSDYKGGECRYIIKN